MSDQDTRKAAHFQRAFMGMSNDYDAAVKRIRELEAEVARHRTFRDVLRIAHEALGPDDFNDKEQSTEDGEALEPPWEANISGETVAGVAL